MSEQNEDRPKLELSPIKVAAGAAAAATAAAVGSTLGVAGTIAGAAVASAISASASALFSHSLERGKDAAKKALPLTIHEAAAGEVSAAHGLRRLKSPGYPHVATPPDESTASDETVVLERGTDATTVPLPIVAGVEGGEGAGGAKAAAASTKWADRLPGWKTVVAVTTASFVIGIGATAAIEVARGKAPITGSDGSFFSNGTNGSGENPPNPGSAKNSGPQTAEPGTPSSSGTETATSTSTAPPTTPATGASTPLTNPSTPSTSPSTPATPPGSASTPANGVTATPNLKTAPPSPPTS